MVTYKDFFFYLFENTDGGTIILEFKMYILDLWTVTSDHLFHCFLLLFTDSTGMF